MKERRENEKNGMNIIFLKPSSIVTIVLCDIFLLLRGPPRMLPSSGSLFVWKRPPAAGSCRPGKGGDYFTISPHPPPLFYPPRSSKAFHFRDSLAHRSSLQMTLTPAVPMKVGPVDCKENKSEVAPFIGSFHPVSRSSSVQLAAAVDHTRFITRRCQTFHLGLPEVTLLGRLVGLDTQNSCLGTL